MTVSAPARTVQETQISMSQLMLPSDANPQGNIHGGTVLKLVDSAAGVVAARHTRMKVVTARLDEMSFLRPVYVGNVLTVKASVNAVFHTSLEIGVRVEAESLPSGETWHVASAYLVFVGLDADDRPTTVPPLIVQTGEEQRRMEAAHRRRDARKR
jgi:acyl-CoA hydrolase